MILPGLTFIGPKLEVHKHTRTSHRALCCLTAGKKRPVTNKRLIHSVFRPQGGAVSSFPRLFHSGILFFSRIFRQKYDD